MFGDDDDRVARKTAAVLRHGMVPLVCVGEWEQQTIQATIDQVTAQVRAALSLAQPHPGLAAGNGTLPPLMIAYEPVWAIGAERAAPVSHISSIVDAVRGALSDLWSQDAAILYGGSVNPAEAAALLECGADGLFVGRAALDMDQFIKIIQEADHTYHA